MGKFNFIQLTTFFYPSTILYKCKVANKLLFTPVSITPLIDTEDACFDLNASRPIAKGDLKWRDALLVAHRVNSNERTDGEA